MMDETNEGAGHADEIFGARAYEAPLPQKKEFLPWHRPRKQFVRERQWLEQINRMLDDSPIADQTLKYLGLPGVDLLDLRYFHTNVCEPRGISLRFLGFNSAANPSNAAQTALNISIDEVRRLRLVDPRSDVVGDDVRGLANPRSLAWKRTLDLGPYDVINLDLCDGFGVETPSDGETPTHYDALSSLMSLQARSKAPWLLLLTTRVGENHVHADVWRIFRKKYASNLVECPPFKAASRELFGIEDVSSEEAIAGRILPLFACGVCKWLLRLALDQKPPTTIEVKSVIGYRVDQSAPHEDLVSIALRCTPVLAPVIDSMGLAQQAPAPPDECALAVKVMHRIAKLRNADDILRSDEELNAKMIDSTANLLMIARYDPVAYRDWLNAELTLLP